MLYSILRYDLAFAFPFMIKNGKIIILFVFVEISKNGKTRDCTYTIKLGIYLIFK